MTGRTDGESEGSLYRFHDVDAPDFRERTVARGDAQSRLVEPRNPANAEKSRSVIFAAGGQRIAHSRRNFSTANFVNRARLFAKLRRKSLRLQCGSILRRQQCGAFSSCRICSAWMPSFAEKKWMQNASTCRPFPIITGATGCTWIWNAATRKRI